MAAAGLGGYVLCGLNTTRRGAALAADIVRADCQVVVTDAEHRTLLDGVDLGDVRVVDASSEDWARMLEAAGELSPCRDADPLDPFMLIFTSGTSGDPKAVQGVALHGVDVGCQPGAEIRCHRRRHLLSVDAALPFQCVGGGLGGGDRDRCGDGSREVLGVELPGRHPPLRRHLHELRRQAAGLHPGHPRATRRRRQSAARRVRQRGKRPRHRRVQPPVRHVGVGRVRLHRERRHHHPGARHPERLSRQRFSGRCDL